MNRILACAAIIVASVTSALGTSFMVTSALSPSVPKPSAPDTCLLEEPFREYMASIGYYEMYRAFIDSGEGYLSIYRSRNGLWVAGTVTDRAYCPLAQGSTFITRGAE